jgi:hypothetical protein
LKFLSTVVVAASTVFLLYARGPGAFTGIPFPSAVFQCFFECELPATTALAYDAEVSNTSRVNLSLVSSVTKLPSAINSRRVL